MLAANDRTGDLQEIDQDLERIRREAASIDAESADADARARADYTKIMIAKATRFEKAMKGLISAYSHIREADRLWRVSVSRGKSTRNEEMDRSLRNLFAAWVMVCDHVRQRAEYFERAAPSIRFREELRALDESARDARRVYITWESPRPSASPALRPLHVSGVELAKAKELFAE